MNKLTTVLLFLLAFVAVYLETAVNGLRWLVGAQVDLLPGLMVYAALTFSPGVLTLLAVLGGVWFDSLSANPAGVSIIPLLAIGVMIHANRTLILRNEAFAQFVLGLAASAAAPVLSVLILLTMGQTPIIGLGSIWQWGVMTLGGAVLTPLVFRLMDWLNHSLSYPLAAPTSFRNDREIKRGRI